MRITIPCNPEESYLLRVVNENFKMEQPRIDIDGVALEPTEDRLFRYSIDLVDIAGQQVMELTSKDFIIPPNITQVQRDSMLTFVIKDYDCLKTLAKHLDNLANQILEKGKELL